MRNETYDELFRRLTPPLAREGLDIQQFMSTLKISYEQLQERYQLSEEQLSNILFGEPTEAEKPKFFTIYKELQAEYDYFHSKSDTRYMLHVIAEGKIFENPRFYKRLRMLLDISQQELANLLDVALPTVQAWEQGRSHATGGNRILLYLMLPEDVKEGILASLKEDIAEPQLELEKWRQISDLVKRISK